MEGIKSTLEFIQSTYQTLSVYALQEYVPLLQNLDANIQIFEINNEELQKISALQHPQGVVGVFQIPDHQDWNIQNFKNQFSLMLDGVQDPGNMGTILRTADWFGIQHIICGPDVVDVYNPKVVQASMGSLSRVNICIAELGAILSHPEAPVSYATVLDGTNVYQEKFSAEGILILGNEGNGISAEIIKLAHRKITVPTLGITESLNVATCAAICCSEIKRNLFQHILLG